MKLDTELKKHLAKFFHKVTFNSKKQLEESLNHITAVNNFSTK